MKRLELCQPFVDKIFESRLLKEISETFRIIFIYFKREKKKKIETFSNLSIPQNFLCGTQKEGEFAGVADSCYC